MQRHEKHVVMGGILCRILGSTGLLRRLGCRIEGSILLLRIGLSEFGADMAGSVANTSRAVLPQEEQSHRPMQVFLQPAL